MARVPDSYVPRIDAQPMQATQVRGDGQVWQPPDMATERIQQFGQMMSQSGGMLMRVGEAIQNRRDDTMVMQNDARLGEAKLKLTDGYRRTVGVAAEESFESTLKAFDEEARKTASTLENDTQRQLFAMRADRHRLDLMSDVMAHRERQSIAAKVGAAEALMAQRGQEYIVAVESKDSARAAQAKALAIDTMSKQWQELRGWKRDTGPEWEAYKKANLTKLHAGAAERLIAIGNPDASAAYVTAMPESEVDPDVRTRLLEHANKQIDQTKGLEAAQAMVAAELSSLQRTTANLPAAAAHEGYKQAVARMPSDLETQIDDAVKKGALTPRGAEVAREAVKAASKMERERIASMEVNAVGAAKAMLRDAANKNDYRTPQEVLPRDVQVALEQVNKMVEVDEWWGNGNSIVVDREKVVKVREILADPNQLLEITPRELDSEYGNIPPMLRAELRAKWRRRNQVALDAVDSMFVSAEDLTNQFVSQVYSDAYVSPEMRRSVEERLQLYVTEAARSGATVPITPAQKKELFTQLLSDTVFIDQLAWDSTSLSLMVNEDQKPSVYVQPRDFVNEDGSKKLFYPYKDMSPQARQMAIDAFLGKQRSGARGGRSARMPSEVEIAEQYIELQRMNNPNYGKTKK